MAQGRKDRPFPLVGAANVCATNASMREVTVTGNGEWVSYSGTAEIVLVVVFAAAAASVAYAGIRLPLPTRLPRPGRAAMVPMIAAWVLAVVALLVSVAAYQTQVYRAGLADTPPGNSITPVTLILTGIATLALLCLSPAVRVQRATLWCLAAMLALFAGWSLFGFSYPSAPGPSALNALAKILALVTALTMFLPQRALAQTPQPAQAAAASSARLGVV